MSDPCCAISKYIGIQMVIENVTASTQKTCFFHTIIRIYNGYHVQYRYYGTNI